MIDTDEWLVAVDRQQVFAQSDWSAWACADGSYHATDEPFARLAAAYEDRVAYTRYIAPDKPQDAWVEYFRQWPQFLVPPDNPMYDFTEETARLAEGHSVISRPTFGKWCPELEAAIGGVKKIALCGVSTDCCVLLTALAAADAGVHVRLIADACAGSTPGNQQLALETMRLFSPLIEVTDSAAVLG